LWGRTAKAGRVRFPHVLWKRARQGERRARCTTEIAPRAFTSGVVAPAEYARLRTARAAAILVDSEALHRGGPTPGAPPSGQPAAEGAGAEAGKAAAAGWISSCSVELCSPSGWESWIQGTGGTVADVDDPEYSMLRIRNEA
jgi:hypothetical protein